MNNIRPVQVSSLRLTPPVVHEQTSDISAFLLRTRARYGRVLMASQSLGSNYGLTSQIFVAVHFCGSPFGGYLANRLIPAVLRMTKSPPIDAFCPVVREDRVDRGEAPRQEMQAAADGRARAPFTIGQELRAR